MLLTVTPLENPGPPSPVPPPTAPKPNKDNARLQRLLRKAAKRSGAQPLPTQSPKAFRSTLSPVTEGDMESTEPAAAQKHLPTPITLPPRFQLRGMVHRVPSPYPKQRNFTFTVPELHSLNQYLSASPIPDTPSPRPSGSSTYDNPFLFPSEGSTSDHASLRVNANASPRPCTPRHVTFNPTPATQPVVPLIPVSDIPMIILPETEPGLDFPNKDENIIEIQSNQTVPNTESGHSTLQSLLPDQQRPTNMSISCITVHLDNPARLHAATSETTNKTEILECSRVAEILCNTSTLPSKPTDENQATTPAHTTDGVVPLVAEVKPTSPPPEVKSVAKPVKAIPILSETDVNTSAKLPNSEKGNLLKTPERPKAPRKKPGGGWARLMKHLVVEPEEPEFPEPQKTEGKDEKKEAAAKQADTEATPKSKGLRANKMWDALLYHMATSNKVPEKPASAEGSTPNPAPATPQFPFLRFRLPLLLHRPRFDARKLKEAASRPLRKVTAFLHRRITDKSSSTFNRTASGWSIKGEDAEQEKKEGDDAADVKNE